ncbi:1577_t:CDS:2 [Ambispora gerdemannii]|uniref:1577_t:CDS:1 n=1 Tax=Ambispora gerdemannii TaxID=144530 RepID=A0A9N8Z6Y7_9GLOM|nr:1577_t:CDS:2 [Ambispora gerdemannii]
MQFSQLLSPITEETTDDDFSTSPTAPPSTNTLKKIHASWSYKTINSNGNDDLYRGVCREKSVYKQQQQQQDQIRFDVYAMPESGSGDGNFISNGNNSLSKCDERVIDPEINTEDNTIDHYENSRKESKDQSMLIDQAMEHANNNHQNLKRLTNKIRQFGMDQVKEWDECDKVVRNILDQQEKLSILMGLFCDQSMF